MIQGAGHHVYADKKEQFNQLVLKACRVSDEEEEYNKESGSNEDSEKILNELPKESN